MTHIKTVTIWCDAKGCSNSYEVGSRSITETRMIAKSKGWVRMHQADWCPIHIPSRNRYQPLPEIVRGYDPMDRRTIHGITSNGWEIVRYDRAGKWYCERFAEPNNERHLLTLEEAVLSLTGSQDQVFLGLPGGRTFDAQVRRARFAAGHEETL